MKDSNLSPQQQALRRSIALYSERSGVSAATISVIAEKFIGLLAGRWEHLCDVALADDRALDVRRQPVERILEPGRLLRAAEWLIVANRRQIFGRDDPALCVGRSIYPFWRRQDK